MDEDEKVIDVKKTSPGLDHLYVDGMTWSLGKHEVWNFSKIRSGQDFKKYVEDGTIVVLDSENPDDRVDLH